MGPEILQISLTKIAAAETKRELVLAEEIACKANHLILLMVFDHTPFKRSRLVILPRYLYDLFPDAVHSSQLS